MLFIIGTIQALQSQQGMEQVRIETAGQMRAKHFPSESVKPYNGQDDYLTYLTSKGVTLNPKLFPSIFHLKNGLPFIGMAVKEAMSGGQVLIRVPEELILSSAKAAQQPMLNQVFRDKFFVNDQHTWQDRVLIVYSLFLLQQKDENNPWYQMIRRLPKQCDIACFWSEDELNSFKDEKIKSAAIADIKSFEQEWAQFETLKQKYEILQFQEYSKENYKIVFANEINRTFGSCLNFVSLVPFAQLCNHHCSKVFFTIQKEKETYFKQEVELTSEESSTGSCESQQYIEQGEFSYDQVDSTSFNWSVKQSYDLSNKQKQKVLNQSNRIIEFIDKSLNWQNITLLFVGQPMLKIKVIVKEYLVGRKPFQKTIQELQQIAQAVAKFKERIEQHYQVINKKPYMGKQEKKSENQVKAQNFKYPVPKQEYFNMIIKTSKRDRFEANNQIYFRYGPNSNRTLLLHYGFAIQGNKYEQLFITLNVNKYLCEFPDVLEKLMEKRLSLLRKFKLYNHRLNMDLIVYFRLTSWHFYGDQSVDQIFTVSNFQKELVVLEKVRSHLLQKLQILDGNYDLTDKSLNYHQYFASVYHKQKLAIVKKQLLLNDRLAVLMNDLSGGANLEKATAKLSQSQLSVLRHYISSIRV